MFGYSPAYTAMNQYLTLEAAFNANAFAELIESLLPKVKGKRSENSVLLYTGGWTCTALWYMAVIYISYALRRIVANPWPTFP